MAEKETTMRLKVDLQCEKCYKKVKKVLCKFPQIREQVFDEKHNLVTIKVVCCNPEKIRDKLCCKGGGAIKTIEIVVPQNSKNGIKEPQPEKTVVNITLNLSGTCCVPCTRRVGPCCVTCMEGKPPDEKHRDKKPPDEKPGDKKPPEDKPPPRRTCCEQCYEGRTGGPCSEGCGRPRPCYCGCYYGRPVYYCYCGGRPCYYVSCCDQYISEENPNACTIM